MKTNLKFKRLIYSLLIAVFILTTSSVVNAQENKSTDSQGFKIIIEKTESGINMQCIEGCEWLGLTFDLNNDRPRSVDQNGVSEIEESFSERVVDPATFLFTINKTEEGIALQGIEGVEWISLSFSLAVNGKQAIDRFGMTSLE